MPTTTHRGLHSTAGTLRAVSGALIALFFLCVRAGGLVSGAPRVISCYTSIMPLPCHTALTRLAAARPPRCCGCLRFNSARISTGVSTAKVLPRAASGLYFGAVAPCISPSSCFALEMSLARAAAARLPAAACTLRPAHFARCVARLSRSSFCAGGRACVGRPAGHFVLY